MKKLLWSGLLFGLAMLAVACNSVTPTPSVPSTTTVAASDATKTRTTIQTWKIEGSGANLSVSGVNAGGQTIHSLSAMHDANGDTSILKEYFTANGAKLQTENFLVSKAGQLVTHPQQKTDASLCPDCMSDDLETLSTVSANQQPRAQLTLACGQARSHLAKVYARIGKYCFGTDYSHTLECLDAFYTDLPNALAAVDSACAP